MSRVFGLAGLCVTMTVLSLNTALSRSGRSKGLCDLGKFRMSSVQGRGYSGIERIYKMHLYI